MLPDDARHIRGRIFGAVGGFYEKYFPGMPSTDCLGSDAPTLPPFPPASRHSTAAMLSWFGEASPALSASSVRVIYGREGLPDVVFDTWPAGHSGKLDLTNAGAVVVLSASNLESYIAGFLRLAEHAREAFAESPTRLHLHGLYIHNGSAEPWVFDRGCMFSGRAFDMGSDPARLRHILLAYSRMTPEQLGLPSGGRDHGSTRITSSPSSPLPSPHKSAELENEPARDSRLSRFELEAKPILVPSDMFTNRPICYRGRLKPGSDYTHVVKFKWRAEWAAQEEQMLELVSQRSVWGVVQLAGHGSITSLREMRQGLDLGQALELVDITNETDPPSAATSSQSSERTGEAKHMGILLHSQPAEQPMKAGGDDADDDNRILSWIAVTPIGTPLEDWADTVELLYAFRDAIKAHKSLYLQGRILHRDISPGNILIAHPERPGEPRGILIDLEEARDLEHGPGRPGEIVGTRLFMGIGMLLGSIQRYRHDLEGFFFVLLRMAICGRWGGLPAGSRLEGWRDGTWRELGERKLRDVAPENFESILGEFRPEFGVLRGWLVSFAGFCSR